ncbi:hypothetical protein TWF281_004101 [Arthrobotrys megalospora]
MLSEHPLPNPQIEVEETQPDENRPDVDADLTKESKPSLTIMAHKLSKQVADYTKRATVSMKGIQESREELSTINQDLKSLIDSQVSSGKQLAVVVNRIENTLTKQEDHASKILESIEAVHKSQEEVQAGVDKMNKWVREYVGLHDLLGQNTMRDQKNTAKGIAELNEKLDRVLLEFESERSPVRKQRLRKSKSRKKSTPPDDAVPKSPLLSTTETTNDSEDGDEDTPAPAKKKSKKSKKQQTQKTGPSQATRSKGGTNPLPSTQQAPMTRRSKRQRSISLGTVIEPGPKAADGNVYIVEETPEQIEANLFTDQQSERVPETLPSQRAPEPKTPKRPPKKRVLAGPATQEAWEMDSIVN